jgi:hypothetical protein
MCEIICWIYFPSIMRPMVVRIENTISGEIPHLRVSIGKILLHAQIRFFWVVDPILHLFEFY